MSFQKKVILQGGKMKKYKIELSSSFVDGANKIIGECNTIEEAKTICEEHATDVLKTKEKLTDCGETNRAEIKHVFGMTGVRYFVKPNIMVSKPEGEQHGI